MHGVARTVHVSADAHAAADVEQDGDADGRIARIKILDSARDTGIDDHKVGLAQVANHAAVVVAYGGGDGHDFDARLEGCRRGLRNRRTLGRALRVEVRWTECQRRREHEKCDREPRHAAVCINGLATLRGSKNGTINRDFPILAAICRALDVIVTPHTVEAV